MKVKLINTTNKLAKCLINKECELVYNLKAYFKYNPEGLDFDYRKGEWRTSIIKNIKIEEISRFCYEIKITTENSEYIFIEGEQTNQKPLTKEEKFAIMRSMIF